MTTSARLIVSIAAGVIVLAGCIASTGSGDATPGGPGPTVPPSGDPTGGGSDGSVGTGVVVDPPSSAEPALPDLGTPTIVVPNPGRLDVHPVGATAIDARVDGRQVQVTLTWWSGVAPCAVLDSVAQVRTDRSIALTILEGADQRGVACIDIAMLKATVVDLGELDPGTYTITAGGDAGPVRIVVH